MQSGDEFFEALTAAQLAILEKLSTVEQLTKVCTSPVLVVVLLNKVVVMICSIWVTTKFSGCARP